MCTKVGLIMLNFLGSCLWLRLRVVVHGGGGGGENGVRSRDGTAGCVKAREKRIRYHPEMEGRRRRIPISVSRERRDLPRPIPVR